MASNKHIFRAETNGSLEKTVNFLKNHESLSMQSAIHQGLTSLYYPDALLQSNAPTEEVLQALEDAMQALTGTAERYQRLYQRLVPQASPVQDARTTRSEADGVQENATEVELELEADDEETVPTFVDVSL